MKHIFLESHNIKNLYSGLGQFNYHLIKAFYRAQHPDFKFTINTQHPELWKKEFGDFFNYHKYRSLSRYKLFRSRKKYDLWHALNQNTKIEPASKMPYLMTVHDVHFIEEQATDGDRKKRFTDKLRRANALVYISEFAKTSTHAHFDISSIPEYVIYNGNPVPADDMDSGYTPSFIPQQHYLFSIGEMTERKNAHSLVAMLRFLSDYHLVIAGNIRSNYYRNVLESIKKFKLQERIHILGKISEKDKKYYLKHCDAFVFPSLREGFGIPPIEAMTYGKPVFLSNRTSLPEIGGAQAYYWDHFDAEYMAEIFKNGITHYMQNPEVTQAEIKERAAQFSWDKTATEYLEIYQKILN